MSEAVKAERRGLRLQHNFRKSTENTPVTEESMLREIRFFKTMENMLDTGKVSVPVGKDGKYRVNKTYFNKVLKFIRTNIKRLAELYNVAGRLDPEGNSNLALLDYWSETPLDKIPGGNKIAPKDGGKPFAFTLDCFSTKEDLKVMFNYLLDLDKEASSKLFSFRELNSKSEKKHEEDNTGKYSKHIVSRAVLESLIKYGWNIPNVHQIKNSKDKVVRTTKYPNTDEVPKNLLPEGDHFIVNKSLLNNLIGNAFYNTGSRVIKDMAGRVVKQDEFGDYDRSGKRKIFFNVAKINQVFSGVNTILQRKGGHKIIPKEAVKASDIVNSAAKRNGNTSKTPGADGKDVDRNVVSSALTSLIAPPADHNGVDYNDQTKFKSMVKKATKVEGTDFYDSYKKMSAARIKVFKGK